MAFNQYSNPDRVEITGELSLDNGKIVTDGQGNLYATSFSGAYRTIPQGDKPTLMSNNATIPTAGYGISRVTTLGAVTGVILEAGTKAGQMVTVVHEGVIENSITFADAKKSNVADGANDVIAGLSARTFIWNSGTGLWYPSH